MKKGFVSVVLAGIALRLAMVAGAGEVVKNWVQELGTEGNLLTATLQLELGKGDDTTDLPKTSALPAQETHISTVLVEVTPRPSPALESSREMSPAVEVWNSETYATIDLRNDTGFTIDLETLAAEELTLTLKKNEPQVLIVHTHGSEAYTPDAYDTYVASDVSRTQDKNYNVVRVGDVLTEKLESYGLTVLHDREIYDYPSYTGSYTRSGASVEQYLEDYPSIAVVIDLHRDAIGSGDVVYKTRAEVPGKSCAQVMLLVGTGENGLSHPYWQENLKLALLMQQAMDENYPTLARPIALKPERYNQHLSTGSLILEVGSSGNTLAEALLAIELFADAVGPALAERME